MLSNITSRLYKIENGENHAVGTYQIGVQPMGRFPKTKISFLEAFGDVAVDFDFAPPELQPGEPFVEKGSKTIDNENTISEKLEDLSITYSNLSTNALSSTKIYPKRVTFDDESKPVRKQPVVITNSVKWPVLVLYGNGDVYVTYVGLKSIGTPTAIKGPLPMLPNVDEDFEQDFCSILCLQSTPPIVCLANCGGTLLHTVLLPLEDDYEFTPDENRPNFVENPDKALYMFETVKLELGLATSAEDVGHNCPILLHRNVGKVGHYFASHETGIHSININCVDDLHKFVAQTNVETPEPDLFNLTSTAEYLICTKMATSEEVNPVIGFAIYYNPPSILALLGNGQLVSLTLAALFMIPTPDVLPTDNLETMTSPLKQMLSEPFDVVIQKILKQSTTQPILKLPSTGPEPTQQECYELLQRASHVFREEYFKNHTKAREEIEKRLKTLTKLKEIQKSDIEKIMKEKQKLQDKAESLAEKYEDIKDKQEEMSKRCEKLLILIAKRKAEPSNAEKEFMKELNDGEGKIETYKKAILKIKNVIKYQELQMKNWHQQNERENNLGNAQIDAIKPNLEDMTKKITTMISEVNEYKNHLNLK
ncbi:nucleoporin nup84-related [Holotrichia oblita]|uniref:Nucleoporin nup84-related n=1 Tax=Holotrichia oblita TaxID=644536 RepID=A0ACB9SGY8_HOLOL|nr:nucleoporin nup84-related [Holotrichia oblita]